METILLEDKVFNAFVAKIIESISKPLVEKVIESLKQHFIPKEDKWISPTEAMRILRIKSKATLQKLRDQGLIRFSHPERRIILYELASLYDYLNAYANKPK